MSLRELVALGTSSQVPTRERSHNAYLLRWDGEGFLFDPGEGAQRQLTRAGIPASFIHYICITHFHGDHCLGLAGITQRLSIDQCAHPVHVYFPESGHVYVERLCDASIYQHKIKLILHPIQHVPDQMLELHQTDKYILKSHPLDHLVPTLGFRLEEMESLQFLPEKLDSAGVHGPMVGELRRRGWIDSGGRRVRLEEMTVRRSGSAFAFVMDTRPCAGAIALAKDADLLVMEATYTSEHRDLANLYLHSTAADAAKTALVAGAHRLALAHFSQRYANSDQHLHDAREIFPNAIALNDLDRVNIPHRPRTFVCNKR
jgi:ribonuclease Z